MRLPILIPNFSSHARSQAPFPQNFLDASRLFHGETEYVKKKKSGTETCLQRDMNWLETGILWGKTALPDFKPKRTRYESVNYGISNY